MWTAMLAWLLLATSPGPAMPRETASSVRLSGTGPAAAARTASRPIDLKEVRLAAPAVDDPSAGVVSRSPAPSGGGPACAQQHDAAAYVCCDGNGGVTICAGRPGGASTLRSCVEQHELDHLAWFAENLPGACVGKARGACRFEMTAEDFRDLECRGYRAEIRCLDRSRPFADGRQIGGLLGRQRQLVGLAESRFGCTLR